MKKKILSLCLVLALLAIAVVGATLAYFTDEAEVDNVFTIGNVDIEIVESTLHRQNDAATDDQILADSETYQDYLAEAGKDMVPGRVVMKAPYINNVGANDAYVRVTVTQSDWFWQNTSMMEYTTAQDNNEIVRTSYSQNEDGTWTTTYVFVNPIVAGELSYYCPFWSFEIKEDVTSNALEALNGNLEQHVIVTADAIQAEGFDTWEAAFAAFDAQA